MKEFLVNNPWKGQFLGILSVIHAKKIGNMQGMKIKL